MFCCRCSLRLHRGSVLKTNYYLFLWRWYENHQNNICPPHEDGMFPADSLVDKRDAFGSSSSEENRGDWHLVRCPTLFLLREHRNIMGHQDDSMVSLALRYYSAPPEGLATPRRGWGSWPGGSRTLKLAFANHQHHDVNVQSSASAKVDLRWATSVQHFVNWSLYD